MNELERQDFYTQTHVDILPFAADEVMVKSWYHSGPVEVELKGVPLVWLLDKIDIKLLKKYLEYKKGVKMTLEWYKESNG